MKLTLNNVALAVALLGLTSCVNEAPWSTGNGRGEGSVKLNLTASGDVSSAVPQVRAISTEIPTPPVEDFHVRITKEDGSMTKEWESVKDFVEEASFSVGIYSIEAFYGDPKAQGTVKANDKGYEYAYYYGITENITVLEGQTTDVELSAGLANSIVDIEYTDEFKSYFNDWQTTLQSDGNSSVNLGSREAMNYVIPGEVAITISVEQQNGKKLTLKPGKFRAEAQHMYKMRYNVYNGEIGNAQLVIEFDENLEQEPIIIDLSRELGNMEPPKVETEGFEPGQNFATLEGTHFNGTIKFNVVAHASISEAVLTINSDTYKPSFLTNGVIDLCKADAATQEKLAKAGVDAIGFYRDPGELARLDLTELCKTLPSGDHKISFQVTDTLMQANEPVEVEVAVIPKEIAAEGQEALFGDGYADIIVSYNGPDPTAPGSNPFAFQIRGMSGGFEDVEVISIDGNPLTRSDLFPVKDYVYRVTTPMRDADELEVKMFFNGEELTELKPTIPFRYPDYKIQIDPMAKSVRFAIDETDLEKNYLFYKKIHVFVDGKRCDPKNLINDDDTGIITIPNLIPGETYQIKTTLETADTPKVFGTNNSVTTESELGVPNGDFEDLIETINTTINQGGLWTIVTANSGDRFQTTLSMVIKEPQGWMSSNSQTCNLKATNKNSWYTIPSVYNTTLSWVSHQPKAKVGLTGQSPYDSTADVYKSLSASSESNAMVIRNVAWDTNGPSIADNKQTGNLDFSNYFCSNHPSEIANRTAGYMYLGSASKEGADFNGRPRKLKGSYRYVPDANDPNEKGKVEIKLLDGETLFATGTLELGAENTYSDFEVPITYVSDTFMKKPTTLQIRISSSNKESDIKTTDYCNKEECCSRGATLYIDNLTFEY